MTGYDDAPAALVLDPPLTTVHNHIIDMGYHAVYEVLNLLDHGSTSTSILSSSLIVRSSCGCGNYKLNKAKELTSVFAANDLQKAKNYVLNYLFDDYKDNFYYEELIERFSEPLELILKPVADGSMAFDAAAISGSLLALIATDFVDLYFSNDKLTHAIRELNQLLCSSWMTTTGARLCGYSTSFILICWQNRQAPYITRFTITKGCVVLYVHHKRYTDI